MTPESGCGDQTPSGRLRSRRVSQYCPLSPATRATSPSASGTGSAETDPIGAIRCIRDACADSCCTTPRMRSLTYGHNACTDTSPHVVRCTGARQRGWDYMSRPKPRWTCDRKTCRCSPRDLPECRCGIATANANMTRWRRRWMCDRRLNICSPCHSPCVMGGGKANHEERQPVSLE